MYKNSILDCVGNTPLVRINNITKHENINCEMFVKCEFINPGGSIKDRIAKNMIEKAEQDGILKQGYTIIEPTSGNTGIGLALCAVIKGYKVIITMPDKMSKEKSDTLKLLGAEVIRTPSELPWNSPDSHIGVAKRLNKEIKDSIILDQYSNPNNPNVHYEQTAEEIWSQCGGKIDYLFAGAGTGGTLSGIGKKLKEKNPDIKIIGIDPIGSVLYDQYNVLELDNTQYKVEGIGYDFRPDVLDYKYIDSWIKTTDQHSFLMARRLIKEEGLLCGGSSGAAFYAAIEYCKKLDKNKRVVVILPDGIRNYMSKFVSNEWMSSNI